MNGGTITFHFDGDTKGIDKAEKQVEGIGDRLGKVASGIGKGFAIASAAAVTAITAITTESVKAYAEYEQLEGGIEALFGKGSKEMEKVMETSKTAYKDLTMSQNDYLNAFQSTYSIMKNGLSDNADAIEYTNKMIQISADLYNTYGGSVENYSNAINWALKGTFSYIDNLNIGIKGTSEGFVEAANSSGILQKEIKNVSELTNDEIIDVIEFYAQSAGAMGRTATEAGTTITGSLNMMKASWTDLLSEFAKGGDLSQPIDNLVQSAMTFADNILPVIETILISIANALPQLITIITERLPGFIQEILPPLITGVVTLIMGLVNAMPQIITVLAEMLPIIIPEVLNGLITIIQAIAEQLPVLLPIIIDAILGIIPILIDNLPLFIKAGFQLIGGLLEGLWNAVPSMLTRVWEIVLKVIDYFKKMPSMMLDIGKNLLEGLWNGIKNATNWVIDKIKGLGSSILKAVKGIFGIHSPSTEFEFIGKMNMEGLEQGMEQMQPELQKSIDTMFDLSPNMTGTMNNTLSPNINVQNDVSMDFDPLGQVVGRIKTFAGGAKNDYNYGSGL